MTEIVCRKGKCVEVEKEFLQASPDWNLKQKIEHDLLMGQLN